MTTEHPITPPPELVQQWADQWKALPDADVTCLLFYIATQAAHWGADQELEACCEWLDREGWSGESRQLRAARHPKPPSLKEQALVALNAIATGANDMREQLYDFDTIRRALEQLDD
jgi:hypothetical protein